MRFFRGCKYSLPGLLQGPRSAGAAHGAAAGRSLGRSGAAGNKEGIPLPTPEEKKPTCGCSASPDSLGVVERTRVQGACQLLGL